MAGYLDDAPARSGLLGYSVKLAAAVIVGGLAVVLIIDGSGLSSKTPAGAEAVAATCRPAPAPVSELVVPAGAHGHFMVEAAVNGTPITFLVDTGATAIYLTPVDAALLGWAPPRLTHSNRHATASGYVNPAPYPLL